MFPALMCAKDKDPVWLMLKSDRFAKSDDGERMPEKLHIEIKPVTNGSAPEPASVEELKANIENITLSPVGINMVCLHFYVFFYR